MNLRAYKTSTSDDNVQLRQYPNADKKPPSHKRTMSSTEIVRVEDSQLSLFTLQVVPVVIRYSQKQTETVGHVEIRKRLLKVQEPAEGALRLDATQYAPKQLRKNRELEMLWLADHKEELKRYQGQWVGLNGYNLLAHHRELDKLVRQLKEIGVRVPFTVFIPEKQSGVFMGI